MDYSDEGRHRSARMLVVIINLLTIVGFGLIGVIIAYLKRADVRGTLWETHFTYYIRGFWLGVLGLCIGFVTTFIFIGVLVIFIVSIWWLIRSINSLLKAIDDRPMPDPETLLF
ncbi:DUF4870 family protein [Niveispirillum sp. KHB5.9]|uniref:DUF4870 family protein n=1 Tax=Niveispirillum sp. KHB5.9 TaxID=3400269 RepID=UPI003A853D69